MQLELIKQKEYYEVLVEGDLWKKAHPFIVGRYFKLTSLTLNDLQDEFLQKEYEGAKRYALNCLAKRSYHSSMLKNLLKKRFVSLNTIERVIKDCEHYGYINDRGFEEAFVKSYLNKGLSFSMIRYKLQAKGIVIDELEDVLKEFVLSDEELIEKVKKLLNTKYKKFDLKNYKDKQKVIASLMRKGFNYEIIDQAIDNLNK